MGQDIPEGPIVLEGQINKEDSLRAFKHFKRKLFLFFRIAGTLLLVTGVLLIFSSTLAGYMVALGLWALLMPFIVTFYANRIYKKNPSFYGHHVITFSDAGVHIKNPKMEMNQDWAFWKRFEESGEDFLLIAGKEMFQAIPKRLFEADEEIIRFRQLLARKIASR